MRDLSKIIDDMMAEIPSAETSLRIQLDELRRSLPYVAPECIGVWWRKTQKLLMREIGAPREGWETKVADIFVGRSS